MSRELADHLKYYEEIGVTGVSRDAKWRQRADAQVGDGYQALLPPSAHFHYWGLGFKQFSLHHAIRASTGVQFRRFTSAPCPTFRNVGRMKG